MSRVTSEVLRKALELLMAEINGVKVETSSTIPMDAADVEALGELKDKLVTVEAVFNAVRGADHAGFKFVKSVDGKTFEQMMEGVSPKELTFYVFKENEADNEFDLYIYDAQQGTYIPAMSKVNLGNEPDLSGYWSKEELKLEDLAKAEDIPSLEGYVKEETLAEYLTLADYGEAMTAEEVEAMFNEVKAALAGE